MLEVAFSCLRAYLGLGIFSLIVFGIAFWAYSRTGNLSLLLVIPFSALVVVFLLASRKKWDDVGCGYEHITVEGHGIGSDEYGGDWTEEKIERLCKNCR